MDTPEPPTVWPPAPTVAPPEAEQTKPFKLRLPLPEWVSYWLKAGCTFYLIVYAADVLVALMRWTGRGHYAKALG